MSEDAAPVEPFGKRLRRIRESRSFSLTELGFLTGVSESAIRQMESGQTKYASLPVGVRIAEVLGVTPSYLAFGEGDGRDEPRVAQRFGVVAVDTRDRLAEANERLARLTERVERGKRGK